MSDLLDADEGRVETIRQLERAIDAKQPVLSSLRSKRDTALSLVNVRQEAMAAVDGQIASIAKEVHRRASCVYLNGKSLDRGMVSLGNEAVSFTGWHGNMKLPLEAIEGIELGVSSLPPRVGIPVIDSILPGKPRPGETMLLTVQMAGSPERGLAVVADVQDAAGWNDAIRQRQQSLGDIAAKRDELGIERRKKAMALAEAKNALGAAQASLDVVEREVAGLRSQRDKLRAAQRQVEASRELAAKRESQATKKEILAREYKNAKDLQNEANKLAKDGWEIQNQSQGSKGKIVVTYARSKK